MSCLDGVFLIEKEEIKKLMQKYNEIVKKCGGQREEEAMRLPEEKCPFQ